MSTNEQSIDKVNGVYVMDALHSLRKPATFAQILKFIAKARSMTPTSIQAEILATVQHGVNLGFIFQNDADKFFIFRKGIKKDLLPMDMDTLHPNGDTMAVDNTGPENPKQPIGNRTSAVSIPSNASSLISLSSVSASSGDLNTDELEFLAELSDGNGNAAAGKQPPVKAIGNGNGKAATGKGKVGRPNK